MLAFFAAPSLWAQVLEPPLAPIIGDDLAGQAEKAYERFLQSNNTHSGPELLKALQSFVERWPSHAGAMLDLALLHCELGNWQAMDEQFQAMERQLTLPVGIAELIYLQRQRGCGLENLGIAESPRSQWAWEVSLGHSNNANLATDNRWVAFVSDAPLANLELVKTNRQLADSFSLGSLSGEGHLSLDLKWYAGVIKKQYLHNPWLNHLGLNLGLWQSFSNEDSRLTEGSVAGSPPSGIGLALSKWWVDNRHQESSVKLKFEKWFKPARSYLGRFGTVAAVQKQDFAQAGLFDSWGFELGLRWFLGLPSGGWVYTGADYFTDAPRNARPGGKRQGWVGQGSVVFPSGFGKFVLAGFLKNSKESEIYNDLFFGSVKRRQILQKISVTHSFRPPRVVGHGLVDTYFFTEFSLDTADDSLQLFSFRAKTLRLGLRSDW